MDARLKKRLQILVKSSMKMAQNAVKGLTTALKESSVSMALTQSSWRFYNNDRVDESELFENVKNEGKNIIENIDNDFVLVAHDYSWLDFKNHNSKEDLILRNKKGNAKGYDLHSSLVIDPNSGNPLAPIAMNLQTSKKIYSSYTKDLDITLTHLQELSKRCNYIDLEIKKTNKDKKAIHIIDREADSVLFMRELQEENSLFLIRVKDNAKVYWNDKGIDIKQKDLLKELDFGKEVGNIKYHKKQARLFVNECDITITRDYTKMTTDENGKKKLIKIPGKPVKARFIVSRVVNRNNKVLATWMLITNVDKQKVDTKSIATWYYYRWNIESYFKLLKTTGFNLEKWQQEKPLALFKRLIVVAYAIVLVFKLANSNDENAKKIREFLVKLSGKLMQRGVEYTLPALLTGLWVFLRLMDILNTFSIGELSTLKNQAQDIMGFNLFEV
jgi:hypothetical protein